MIDLHVHTRRCRHADGTAAEYLAVARAKGIAVIAFTEHLPLSAAVLESDPHAVAYAMPVSELADYVAEIEELKALSRTTGGPDVLLGIEADLHPGNAAHVEALLSAHNFDMVMGSVHYVDGWAFDDPDRTDGYDGWDIDVLWERYFEDLGAAAESGIADVIAHADLVKKFRRLPRGPVSGLYERFAGRAARSGVAVEVNTAGLRKPCGELYPGPELLRALVEAGVPITVGSDAHSPRDVGEGWHEATDVLRQLGVDELSIFRRRRREAMAL